jgi:glutamate N-acetyltransferase/amino-acid N-acetyltransferase
VKDARTAADAMRVAKTIANSPLVKTAVHGADPNWGRHRRRGGAIGRDVRQSIAPPVHVGGVLLFENGLPHDGNAPQAAEHLKQAECRSTCTWAPAGAGDATVWTCDLTAEYVKINGEYRT